MIFLLILIGGSLRFRHLDSVSPRISADEYITTCEVFLIFHGKGPALFGLDWKPMPALTEHLPAPNSRRHCSRTHVTA
jgi:hypothetical protein